MALTLEQAMRATNRDLPRGMFKSLITYDAFFAMLAFEGGAGESIVYNRELSLGSAAFIAANSGTVSESSATWEKVTALTRTLAADVDVPGLAAVLPNQNNMGVQLAAKIRQAGRTLATKAITGSFADGFTIARPVGWNGDYVDTLVYASPFTDSTRFGVGYLRYTHAGTLLEYKAPGDDAYGTAVACASDGSYTLASINPNKRIRVTLDVSDADENGTAEITFTASTNDPDGIFKFINPSGTQLIASSGADGDVFGFSTLDALIDAVKVDTDLAFLMNGTMMRKYFAACRALGGANPDHIRLPGYGSGVPTYRGIPILRNDNIASTEAKGAATTLSSVVLVSMTPGPGFSAFCVGNESEVVNGDPRVEPVLGFMVEQLGSRLTADAKIQRVKWYGGYKLGSELAVARASELITA